MTEYEYDAVGDLVSVTDPLDHATTYQYNTIGQLTSATDALGNATSYLYDAAGNLIRLTEPLTDEEVLSAYALGATTEYVYDSLGQLLSVTDAEGGVTSYAYDLNGNLLTLTDPEGNTTSYVYDSLGRVIEETNELADTRYFVYNDAGLLVRAIDREGRVIVYQYDNLYRNTGEIWYNNVTDADADQNRQNTISYTYDAAGNLLTASDSYATYAYEYDGLGRVYEEIQTIAGIASVIVLTHEYDAMGNLAETAASIGGTDDFVNTYIHDNLGRLTRLTQDDQGGNAVAEKRVDFTYDAASRYSTIKRYKDTDGGAGNLVMTGTYVFDTLNRLTGLVYANATPSTIRSFEWTFDAAGRMVTHTSDIASENVSAYTHDDTNQLTDADYTTGSDESYTYDDNGNRVTANGSTYETDTNNRLVSDGYFRYEYDAEGNLIYRYVDADSSDTLNANDTDITQYTWDHRNRLTDVLHKDIFGGQVDWTAEYIYDAFNRRIGSLFDLDGDAALDREERYVWDGRNVLLDFIDSDGAGGAASLELTTRYLWGQAVDQLFAQETVDDGGAEDVLWPITDNLGSVRSLVNYLGQITATYSYDSFGNVTVQAGVLTDTRYHFTCQEYDVSTGFYYYDARWYDPAVGKFISEDPSGLVPDANFYRYVDNSPLTFRDPLGMDKDDVDDEYDPNIKRFQRDKDKLFNEIDRLYGSKPQDAEPSPSKPTPSDQKPTPSPSPKPAPQAPPPSARPKSPEPPKMPMWLEWLKEVGSQIVGGGGTIAGAAEAIPNVLNSWIIRQYERRVAEAESLHGYDSQEARDARAELARQKANALKRIGN